MSGAVLEPRASSSSFVESDCIVIEMDDETLALAEAEKQNEIIALNEADGQWKLNLSDGFYRQWDRVIAALTTDTNEDSNQASIDRNTCSLDDWTYLIEDKVFIVSLLGNTSSGKSFVARHLLNDSQDCNTINGPVCIDEPEKKGATTVNINCYVSESKTNQKTLVLDYEGEKGSAFPLLHYARQSLRHLSRTADQAHHRRQAVADYFPKLAYILSDVVILLGNDDLACTDYLTRCREFVLKANDGVSQMVDRPLLIIVQNKASIAQSLSYDVVTRKFFEIHGQEAADLRIYFSGIKCFCLPHKEQLQRTKTGILDGKEIFDRHMADLKGIFSALHNHKTKQLLTHAQWLYLLHSVLPIVQSGKSVSLHTLLNEIVAHDDNQMIEISRRCFLYFYNLRPIHTPAWFDNCCRFAIRVLAHLLAVKAYDQRELMSERIIHEQCEKAVEQLSNKLDEFQPCEALYNGKGRSSRNQDNESPIFCYQHKGAHEGGHRTCQSVYGLTQWKKFWNWSSTDVWPGEFVSSARQEMTSIIFSDSIIKDLSYRVREQMNAFREDPEATYYLFTDLLLSSQFSEEPLEIFRRVCFCGSCSTSTFVGSNAFEHHTRRFQLSPITLVRNLLLISSSQSNGSDWVACSKCYRKLDAAWNRFSTSRSPPFAHTSLLPPKEVPDCSICFDGKRDFLFIPCGHRGFCESCADKILGEQASCPFCRSSISGKQRVHDV
ncbi:unnamed protein product [Rotaria sp. Silwood2]|nr:unnamed protein product [Rotaria sp. Silwood2]CAF2733788.1 unnamed protein product [Rotaria sp. Silwood2]CAF3387684.1 unnamed protein product [Rotaria sp. Silwood2]CAF3905811.1 unnamed protein product [Rotaria sp. Silwood2]CAF3927572.1 unnamed protein product [Rotaria sp. Silwood2]